LAGRIGCLNGIINDHYLWKKNFEIFQKLSCWYKIRRICNLGKMHFVITTKSLINK
jgi:hypothetical protein